MASRRKQSKAVPFNAADIANLARSNPYIQQLIQDPKLRKHAGIAIDSSKSAYGRLNHGNVSARGVLQDKKLHQDLGRVLGAARDVTIILTESGRRRRRGLTFGRAVMLVFITAGVALAVSEQLRSKVLDLLFGSEEEFQYTPPPANAGAPESTPTAGAA